MRYAGCVGRVGALAVALGVGGAVANGTGIAWATPESDDPGVEAHGSAAPTGAEDPGGEDAATANVGGQQRRAKPTRPRVLVSGVRDVVEMARDALETLGDNAMTAPRRRQMAHGQPAPPIGSSRTVVVRRNSAVTPPSQRRASDPGAVPVVGRSTDDGSKAFQQTAREFLSPPAVSVPKVFTEPRSIVTNLAPNPPVPQARSTEAPLRPVIVARPLPRLLSVLGFGVTPGRNGGRIPENPLTAAILGFVRRLDRTLDNKTPVTDFRQDQLVQVDEDHAVGYLDPVDRDGDLVTYTYTTTGGGSVAFDPVTPGKFTYSAPADWTGDEWRDTVTITASDAESGWHLHGLRGLFDGGHTTTQTVSVVLKATDDLVPAADGSVAGRVPADNRTLTYRLADPDVDVVLDEESGEWTYTPSAQARLDAAGAGPKTFTFRVIALDGEHETPITFTAPIRPAADAPVVLPPGAVISGPAVNTGGGAIAVTSTVDNKTFLTVIDKDGIAHTSQPMPGTPTGSPVFVAGGTAYQTTFDEQANTTFLNVVLPNGTTKSVEVPGQIPGGIVIGQGGEAYITSVVEPPNSQTFAGAAFAGRAMVFDDMAPMAMSALPPLDGDTDGAETHVWVMDPNGVSFEVDHLPGRPLGELTPAADGVAYQATYTSESGVFTTHVTVIDTAARTWETTDADDESERIDGMPYSVMLGPQNRLYVTTYDNTDGAETTTVSVVDVDGTVTRHTMAGTPVGGAALKDGNVYQITRITTNTDTQAAGMYLNSLSAAGDLGYFALTGDDAAYGGDFTVDDDGALYLATVHYGTAVNDPTKNYVVVVAPDGTIHETAGIGGGPGDNGLVVGADGTVHLVTVDTTRPGGARTLVTAVHTDGTTDRIADVQGVAIAGGTHIDADGTLYVTGSSLDGARTFVSVVSPAGAISTVPLPGTATGNNAVAGPNGVVYQVTTDYATQQTFMSVIRRDGAVVSYPLSGWPANGAPTVAADGTVYWSVYTFEDNGEVTTHVAAMSPDGRVRTSASIPGDTGQNVLVDADGTVYQTTSTGVYELAPATWQVHRPPTATTQIPPVFDPSSGFSSGAVVYADPDGDSVTYGLADGTDPAVVLAPDGTWTVSPTDEQRHAAFYGTGPDSITFTVIVSDGEYRIPVIVSAPVDPDPGTAIELPAGATPRGAMIIGGDGTAYQMSYNESANTSYLTVIPASGSAFTSDPLPGGTIDGPVAVGDNLYQLTWDSLANTAYISVVDADGKVTSTELPGQIYNPIVLGPNDTVYQTTITQASSSGQDGGLGGGGGAGGNGGAGGGPGGTGGGQPAVTYITLAGPDGVHTAAITGSVQGPMVVDPDGFAYVTVKDAGYYLVGVVSPTGTIASQSLSRQTSDQVFGGVVLDSNGVAHQSVYDPTTQMTTVATVGPDASIAYGAPVVGAPISGLVAAPDGTIVQTTYIWGEKTIVSGIASDGSTLYSHEFDGPTGYGPTIGPDGAVYQTYYTGGVIPGDPGHYAYETFLVTIRADGPDADTDMDVHVSDAFTGLPNNAGPYFDTNGNAYIMTDTESTGVIRTVVTTFDAQGDISRSVVLPGHPLPDTYQTAPDGSMRLITFDTNAGGPPQFTNVNFVDVDGNVHTTVVRHAPYSGGTVVDLDGTLYQLTTDSVTGTTYVTTIDSSGVVHNSDAMPGVPSWSALDLAPDGTVYVTTSVDDHAAGKTYLATVRPDGTLRISDALTGYPSGGVVFDSRGTAYQATSAQTTIVDSTGWEVRNPPGLGLPAGTSPSAPLVFDGDGNAFETSYSASSDTTQVTIVGADGIARTSDPIRGQAVGSPIFGTGDATYLLTDDGGDMYLNTIVDDGTVTRTALPGATPDTVVVTSGGVAYVTTTATAPDGTPSTTIAVIRPDGTAVAIERPGEQANYGSSVVGSDGTVYQTTSAVDPGDGGVQTFVTIIRPDGSHETIGGIPGNPSGKAVIGADGLIYQTTTVPTANAGEYDHYVTVIGPDGVPHTTPPGLTGAGDGGLAAADGFAYQTIYMLSGSDYLSYIITMSPEAGFRIVGTAPGTPVGLVVIDDVAYQATRWNEATPEGYQGYASIVEPNGTVTSFGVVGSPRGAPLPLADGTIYQLAYRNNPIDGSDEALVTVIHPDGSRDVTEPVRGSLTDGALAVAPDGTVFMTTSGNGVTTVSAVGADGSVRTVGQFAGTPTQGVTIGPDGATYQTTSSGTWIIDVPTGTSSLYPAVTSSVAQ